MNDLTPALAANSAYYAAFRARDLEGMKRIWAERGVSCIHPGWALLRGRAQVIESYRRILANPNQSPVSCSDATVIVSGDFARVLCVEHVGGGALAATNLFVLAGDAWRLVHHHAGPIATRVPQETRTLN
jgi:ketosteroid isomerase-like protein